jgi:hypothetical protein
MGCLVVVHALSRCAAGGCLESRQNAVVARAKKSAARGSPLAATGIDYNRICSLPETSVVLKNWLLLIA